MLYRILTLLILLLAAPAWGATYTPTSHAEMVTAIAALEAGDTITISGSWTAETAYEISDNNVTINSSSSTNTITSGTDSVAVINLAGTGQTITGFKIDGDKDNRTDSIGIDISGSSATVSGMTIVDACLYGVRTYVGSTGNTITGNTITNSGKNGVNKNIYANAIRINSTSSANITDNIISSDSDGSHSIVLNTPAEGGTISGNTITGGTDGIQVITGSSLTISGNTISNFALSAPGDGINLTPCLACTVSGNTITQSSNSGNAAWAIEVTGDADASDGTTVTGNTMSGAYLNRCLGGGGSNITFSKNHCEAIDNGIYYQNPDSSIFRANIIIVNGGSDDAGIFLDSNAAGERLAYVYNNTIVDIGDSTSGIRFEEATGTWGAAEVKNNIIQGFAKGLVIEDAGDNGIAVVHTHNDYYGNTANVQKDVGGSFSNEDLGTGEITTNPLLNATYGIPANSPVKDAGAVLYTYAAHPGDYLGAKVYGSAPDIGAIEYKDHTFGGWFFEMFIPTIFNLCASTNASCYTQP